jgi:hypothetical protein
MVTMSVTEYRDSITKSEWHRERFLDVAREVISHRYHKAGVYKDAQLNAFGRLYLEELDGGNNYQRISTDLKRIKKIHGIHGQVCCIYYVGWIRANGCQVRKEYWNAEAYIPKNFTKDYLAERKWLDEKTKENMTYQCEEPAIQFYQTGNWDNNFERKFAKSLGILVRRKCLLVFSEKGESWVKDIMRKRSIPIVDPPPWLEVIAVRMRSYSRKFSTSKTETPPTAPASSIPVE